MDSDLRNEESTGAFQIWMGQWRLSTLDAGGCMFVLRFLLRAFRTRKPDDMFWSFLERFLYAEEQRQSTADYEYGTHAAKELLAQAGTLPPEEARALMAFLSECYAMESDRVFWTTVTEAIQLYTIAPYDTRSAGTA